MNAFRLARPVLGAVAGALALLAAPAGADGRHPAERFALLPLVAGDTGMPYQVFPTVSERSELGGKLEAQVVRGNGGVAIAGERVASALVAGGYDQNDPYRQCDDAACARKLGRRLRVDTVVFGSVTRAMAMIWGTEVSLVDVATGRVHGPYALGYKGDYITLETGVDTLARAVTTRLIADAAERTRGRAMALHR